MPSQLQHTTPTRGPSGPVPSSPSRGPAGPQDTLGNQALQDSLSSKSAGQLTWEAALGESLGSKLYEALSDKLSDDELRQAAEGAVESATDKLGDFLAGRVDASEQEAAAALVSALDAEIKRIAGAAATGEVADLLRELVDDNPLVITSAAVAAATAWVLSNQGIGMLSSKVKLGGGHSLVGGIDPGKTLDLAVQQVRVGYRYQGGGTSAEVIGDYFADDSWKVTGRFSQQTERGGLASVSGVHHQRNDDESRTRLDLGYRHDGLGANAFWERERSIGSDVSTLGGSLSASRDDWSAYMRAQASTDGSREAAGGFHHRVDDDMTWGVEGFSKRDAFGQADRGVQAVFKWRF